MIAEFLVHETGMVAHKTISFAAVLNPSERARQEETLSKRLQTFSPKSSEMERNSKSMEPTPLDNARTTAIAPGDLLRFLEAVKHPPLILDLDAL